MTDTLSPREGARTADEPPAPLPQTDIAVLRVDLSGRILFSNGLLERGMGRQAGALIGLELDGLLDERCRAQVVSALRAAESSASVLDEVRFADGRVSTMNGAFQVARDPDGIWLVRLPTAAQPERVRDDLAERNRDLARSNSDLAKAIEQLKEQKHDLERQQEQLLEQATELQMQTEELEAQKEELARQAESLAEARRRAEAQADEYRHVSDLLHKANEQLEERAQALRDATEAKSRFLATMSHELRTPLNAVLGYSGLLRDGVYGSMTQAQERAILNIVRRAKDLQLLIDDVLDLSKIEAGRMELRYEDFDPRTIVAEVEETIAPLAGEKGLTVTTKLASAPASVRLDRTKYKQVLTNLASNAVKFTPVGGTVEITVESASGERFATKVRDTGIGIAPNNIERIFESFRQVEDGTTRRYGGTGLGLAIARRLTELMNGTIRAESTLGKGATFVVTLPVVSEEEARAVAATQPPEPAGAASDPVVLAIDDDPEVILLLRDSLAAAGFRVVGALDANRGLELARMLEPFAITLDIMMPEKDGWEVLKELKADPELADIPVLIMSIVSERALGFSLGVTDYLVKPVDRKVLIDVLDRLRERRRHRVALVVDEDPDARLMLEDLLRSLQFEVQSVAGGADALHALDTIVPTVLFLSATMPEDELAAVIARVQSEKYADQTRTVLVARTDEQHHDHDWLRRAATAVVDDSALAPGAAARDSVVRQLRAVLGEITTQREPS